MFQATTPLTGHWYIMSVTMSFSRGSKWYQPYVGQGFPGGSVGKESACNVGDLGSISGWEDPLEKDTATHSSILAWRIPWTEEPGRLHTVHGVAKSWTRLSYFHFYLCKTIILAH